ncbi:17746_t:CDS:1, partial [Racocetra fulgida]
MDFSSQFVLAMKLFNKGDFTSAHDFAKKISESKCDDDLKARAKQLQNKCKEKLGASSNFKIDTAENINKLIDT